MMIASDKMPVAFGATVNRPDLLRPPIMISCQAQEHTNVITVIVACSVRLQVLM